jgi:hypothetical protein
MLALGAASLAAQSPPTIRLNPGPDGDLTRTTFDVDGLDGAALAALAEAELSAEGWSDLFAVTVDRGAGEQRAAPPPIVGTYRIVGAAVRFTPRFPLAPGLRYRAVLDPARLPGARSPASGPIAATFTLPARPRASTTTVVRVDPAVETLPENQLKLYLHFSAPMRRGEAYDHVHLLDADGRPLDLPFLELGEELWDPGSRRLTLLFDPGRIKRGLKPREDLGPVLVEGRRYTLVVDGDWPDATGNPLKAPYRKTFHVGPPDDRPPDPRTWKVTRPRAGSLEPLVIGFPEPLDRAMLDRALGVVGPGGQPSPGRVEVADDATAWRFTPERPWREGRHALVIDTTLEDLAGNSIGRPFEVDAERPIRRRVEAETYRLPFRVEPGDSPDAGGTTPAGP